MRVLAHLPCLCPRLRTLMRPVTDPQTRRVVLLGSSPVPSSARVGGDKEAVIVTLEKTAFDGNVWAKDSLALQHMFARFKRLGQNDIYSWLLGWTPDTDDAPADVKINVIRPASEAVRFWPGLALANRLTLTPDTSTSAR